MRISCVILQRLLARRSVGKPAREDEKLLGFLLINSCIAKLALSMYNFC
jgi:hypothetical protein